MCDMQWRREEEEDEEVLIVHNTLKTHTIMGCK